MKNCLLKTICIILPILMFCGQVNADSFLVLNQQGLPIKNVVLEFTPTKISPTLVTPVKTLVMDQIDKLFKPEVLIINKGDYVSFPNSDNIRHHVYSFSSVKPFELKLYSGQPKAPLQFNTAGISVLGCNIHDSMVGYIYIANSAHTLLTDEYGKATLADDIQYKSVNIWHANLSSSVTNTQQISYDDLTKVSKDKTSFLIKLVVDSPEPRNTFQSIFKQNGK
jgi:plastocyanin